MVYFLFFAISVIFAVIFFIGRRRRLNEAYQDISLKSKERDSWKAEKYMSFGEVQKTQNALKAEIENRFEDGEQKELLIDIVTEWANLKIKSFQDRRSWLRKPEVHDVQSSIEQSHGKIQQ